MNLTPMLDMGELDNTVVAGKPLDILVDDIAEDPDNSRTVFDIEYIEDELGPDIKQRGVISPVSVRKNPSGKTKWILNYGACRLRASIWAGKETIPAFIGEQFDSYDQFSENDKRRDLSAIEIMQFIKKRQLLGDSKGTIAKHMCKTNDAITRYLALDGAPPCIDVALNERRITAPRAAYDLRKLYKKQPGAVTQWCGEQDTITVASVKALKRALDSATVELSAEQGNNEQVTINADTPQDSIVSKQSAKPATKPKITKQTTTTSKAGKSAEKQASMKLNNPCLTVLFDGKKATVLLDRCPATYGCLLVCPVDSSQVIEVKSSDCVIVGLHNSYQWEPA